MEGTPFGRYRLLEPLGSGAMGEVHRAYDTDTDRVVALKVLASQFVDDELYRSRFQREARAAAKLREPHIVPIHDFGEIDGRLFLEMRLVEGPNLARLLADKKQLTPAAAVAVIDQIAAALDAAHAEGLVHRDVKPSNILVTADDFAYLIDFGIARSEGDTTLTATGAMIGTFAYMAPERLTDDDSGVPSDVYSLTCVLYECLTGAKPYAGESVQRQIAAHLNEKPPRPSTIGIPPAFDAVIAKGMAKKPDARYGSAGDLAAAARRALVRLDAPPRRPRRALGVAAAVLLVAIAGGSALALTRTGSTVVTDAPTPGTPVTTVDPPVPLGDQIAPLPRDAVSTGTVPADSPAPAEPPAPESVTPIPGTSAPSTPAPGAPAAEPTPTTSWMTPGDTVAEPGTTAPAVTTPPAPPPIPPPATPTSEPPPDTTTVTATQPPTTPSTPATTTSAPTTTPPVIPSAKDTSATSGTTSDAAGERAPSTTTGSTTVTLGSTTPAVTTITTTAEAGTTTAAVAPTG